MDGLDIVAAEEATYPVVDDIVVRDRLDPVVGNGSIDLLDIQLVTTTTAGSDEILMKILAMATSTRFWRQQLRKDFNNDGNSGEVLLAPTVTTAVGDG